MAKQKNPLIKDREGIWYVWFNFERKQIRRSTGLPVGSKENEKLANERAHYEHRKLYEQVHFGNYKHTWKEGVLAYLKKRKSKYKINGVLAAGKYLKEAERMFNRLTPVLPFDMDLDEICQDDISKMKDMLYQDGVSSSTVNKYLELVRAVLRLCSYEENDDKSYWLNRAPRVELEPKSRKRRITLPPEKFWELYDVAPEPHKDMMVVAVTAGLRDKPVRLMKKEWLHFDTLVNGQLKNYASIPDLYSKNSDPIEAPLTDLAVEVIKKQMNRFPESEYVFCTKFGKPLSQTSSKAWYTALEKVGLKGKFRWHDLRHVFAANHILQKTPEKMIMQLGGWKTSSMLDRYVHLEGRELDSFAEAASSNIVALRPRVTRDGTKG